MKIGMVSLGCPKNLVDSEVMLGIIKDKQLEITNNPADAELIIVNTCGFIESAKEESISTILQMAQYKEEGHHDQRSGNKRAQNQNNQHNTDDLLCGVPFSRIHSIPPTAYTRRNLRMESILPNTPTTKPVIA